MPRSSRFVSILLAAVLAGCATTGGTPPSDNPRAAAGPYRDTIDLRGKLAVTYQKDGQPQRINGPYTWTQRPGTIDVELFSPLGQTVAVIHVTPGSASMTLSDGKPRVARDIDTLTRQTLGWTLPVSGLRDWLQGYATDAQGQRFTASPAHDNVFTNDGWRLRFAEWQSGQGSAAALTPRRIQAERSATANSDELAITILIDPAA
jgi:outer membrane lipoprotein LolB